MFICAHLKPVIQRIKLLTPDLKQLHVLSDGPTTQYRNKTMFHLIANYLSKISKAEIINWHFSEAGHGKGAPDGVGGCIKRTCDNAVTNGQDISNIDSFISCLKGNCKGIEIFAKIVPKTILARDPMPPSQGDLLRLLLSVKWEMDENSLTRSLYLTVKGSNMF